MIRRQQPNELLQKDQVDTISGRNASTAITLAAIIVIIFGMQAAKVLLVPFLLAVFLALITVRPMLWLQQHKVPSVLAALLVLVLIMLVLAVVGTIVGASIAEFTAALPAYQARLDLIVERVLRLAATHMEDGRTIEGLSDLVDPGWAMRLAANILNALRDVLTNTFLILFTMVFILLEASSVQTKIRAAFGRSAESFENATIFLNNLGRYLGIKTVISMATGLCAGLITWWIGLDFALLWGMLAFLLNYVPTIGSIIAAVPAVLMALVQLGIGEAGATAIGFIALNVVFGNFLEPRLMGYGVGISPLVVFTGLVFWGWVFGPVGMLLSVPLTMTLKLALENDSRTRWIAILIGSERDAEHELTEQDSRQAA
jgi:predicted PurR-regulated permease PerM